MVHSLWGWYGDEFAAADFEATPSQTLNLLMDYRLPEWWSSLGAYTNNGVQCWKWYKNHPCWCMLMQLCKKCWLKVSCWSLLSMSALIVLLGLRATIAICIVHHDSVISQLKPYPMTICARLPTYRGGLNFSKTFPINLLLSWSLWVPFLQNLHSLSPHNRLLLTPAFPSNPYIFFFSEEKA